MPPVLLGMLYRWDMPPEEVDYVATQANATADFHIPPTPYNNLMYVVGVFRWYAIAMKKPAERTDFKKYGTYAVYNRYLKVNNILIPSSEAC